MLNNQDVNNEKGNNIWNTIQIFYNSFTEHMEHARHLETQRYQFLGFSILFIGSIICCICNKSEDCKECFHIIAIFLIIWIIICIILTFIWNMLFEKHRKFAIMYSNVINDYYIKLNNNDISNIIKERIFILTNYFAGSNKFVISRPYILKTRTLFISLYIYALVFIIYFFLCIYSKKICVHSICCVIIGIVFLHLFIFWFESKILKGYDKQIKSVEEDLLRLLDTYIGEDDNS